MNKLIVSDFDGTLCENNVVSNKTIKNISDIIATGKVFAISSGRDLTELCSFFDSLKNKICFVAFDGALAVYDGHLIFHTPISEDAISRSINLFDDCTVRLIGAKTSWSYNDKTNMFPNDIKITKSFQIKDYVYKIVFYKNVSEIVIQGLRLHYADEFVSEFVPSFANKGVALGAVQRHFGISVFDTLAIGDNDNDVAMMQNAKYSVSVGSRDSKIHDCCDYHYPSGNDVLEKVLKNEQI